MALINTPEERARSQAQREAQLTAEREQLEKQFGPELGVALFAYLYPENNPQTDEAENLNRQLYARVLATFMGGTEEQRVLAVGASLWLSERLETQILTLQNQRASDNALY